VMTVITYYLINNGYKDMMTGTQMLYMGIWVPVP
jgi:hypothetical protein